MTRSTIRTEQTTIREDGREYPLVAVDVSSASHPFCTGRTKFVDAAGRVDEFQRKFRGRYGAKERGAATEVPSADANSGD